MQTAPPSHVDLSDPALPTSPDDLVRQHLPLVHHVVADMIARVPRHIPRDELTSAALFGLVQAAQAFDPSRGVTFDRYARRRMQGALLDDLRSRDWASRGVRAQARKIRSATADLSAHEVSRLNDDVHRATVLNYDSVFRDSEDCDALSTVDADPGEVIL